MSGYMIMELYGSCLYGQVLAQFCCTYNKHILLESACEAFLGKLVNPIQPLGSCGAKVLKLSSCRQGWSTYVDSIDKQQDATLLGLYQLSYICLQVTAAV